MTGRAFHSGGIPMAKFYTLEEAALHLGMTTDEFKRRHKTEWTNIRPFRDGPTLRFRSADIDELARSLGHASEPDLQLGEPVELTQGSDEMLIVEEPAPAPKSKPKPKVEEPLLLNEDTEDIFTVPMETTGSPSSKKKRKLDGDSDVRLDTTPPKFDPDGDLTTEEFTLEAAAPRSGVLKAPSSGKLKGSSSGKLNAPSSGKIPGPTSTPVADDGSSEFELSLDSDSDSFELQLNTDSSEEVDLAGPPSGGKRGGSGINLAKPSDSGVLLESTPSLEDDSIEFDLSLDSPGASGSKLGTPRPAKKEPEMSGGSDSEFELSLEDSDTSLSEFVVDEGEEEKSGDIFETDFELPAVTGEESGSEVVAMDDTDSENSDFDLAIDDADAPVEDESASQVMLVDDEEPVELEGDDALVVEDEDDAPKSKKGKKKKAAVADFGGDDDFGLSEDYDEDSAAGALRGVRHGEEAHVRTVVAPQAKWGWLPATMMIPCLIIVCLGGLMSFEMVRSSWGYQQPAKTGDSIVRGMADTFDMKVND